MGFFYFSSNGRAHVPWKGGPTFQCVQPPVQRTQLIAGSTWFDPCFGEYAFEFNAWMAGHPAEAPPAGTTVQMQLLTFDPAAPASTAWLLDAIELTVGP